MKKMLLFSSIMLGLLVLATPYADGQTCPFDTVTYNNATLPTGVIPSGNTIAQLINVAGDSSSYIKTDSNVSTTLIAEAPESLLGNARIVIGPNFQTHVVDSATFTCEIKSCDSTDTSSIRRPVNSTMPASLAAASRLLAYPTVSTGLVTVTGSSAALDNADVLVVDESGHTVYHLHNSGNTTVNLYLGNLSNGLYFIRVNNGSGTVLTQRIIIQH